LSTADDLLTEADGHGLELAAVISKELSPYPEEQISIAGEPVLVPGKLAVSLALVVHELATNAAKYRELSTSNGSIHISWTGTDGDCKFVGLKTHFLVWSERRYARVSGANL
jgi:two-component sensor histidine kinase